MHYFYIISVSRMTTKGRKTDGSLGLIRKKHSGEREGGRERGIARWPAGLIIRAWALGTVEDERF
jgi:hypothetical protein